jgi:phospholipid/cholesterol/gamma-HCH transport system substrate-binding protein
MPSPRQIHWAQFRALAVTVVATIILLVLLYLLTGGTMFQRKASLYMYISDASGLGPGSPVRVDGIGVGKVSNVKLSGSNQPARVVQVTMSVEFADMVHIPADSTADIGTDSLLGDKFIGIESGTSARHLAPGGEIARKPEATSLDLVQFGVELRTVDATLRGIEDGSSPLGQFVLGDGMYRDLLHRLDQIDRGLRSMGNTTTQIGRLLYTDKTFRKIDQPLLALDQTLARIQSGQGAMGQMVRDSAQYDQLRAALVDVSRSVDDFRSAPLVQSDAMYRQWNRELASMVQRVDELNGSPLFSSSEVYDNLNGLASQMRDAMRDFRGDPRKFLRLKMF